MKKQFIMPILSAMVVIALSLVGPLASNALAIEPSKEAQEGFRAAGGGGKSSNLAPQIEIVINLLLFVIGAVAVVMIVIGGIKYTISNGDSGQLTSAKNTILYSVIGLVIALLAYAIVNFVLRQF